MKIRETLRIRVLTDGRAGNEKPAVTLAESVAAAGAPAEVILSRLTLSRGFAWLPARAWLAFAPRRPPADLSGWPFAAATIAPPLEARWPDLVIGAGRRAAPFVLELKRRSAGRTVAVQILDPRLPPERFDLVITPEHDRLTGPHVLTTLGQIGRPPAPPSAPDPRLAALPRPLIGALIGGPSGSARVTDADFDALGEALATLGRAGAGLAATPSRRTPPASAERLAARVRAVGGFFWDGAGDNPYAAILAQADALVVTADSVNMASEAASAGKPLYVAPVAHLAPKLGRFHAALAAAGHARPLARGLERGRLDGWRPDRPLDTLSPAVARVVALLRR